ncbi:MAG TPA: DUF1302 domain-containing protein [Duganella sp.]|uniref:DUF1302 domain-containing protein n=1 Tax=Duganella sp. TaxID=1904440 RepID=UPI002ED41396
MLFSRPTLALAVAFTLPHAHAVDIASPDPDLKVRLDLTPKYSSAYRLREPSPGLTRFDLAGDPNVVNEDDGDHNFRKGLISSRFDMLAELDVTSANFGARLSGTGWYDGVYLRRNRYAGTPVFMAASPTGGVLSTASNKPGQAPDQFLPGTRYQHGRGAEVLDAFVYAKGELGGMPGTVRVGKHTVQWGESLFFGQNGIANAQGPVNISKVLSVPAWQFKEVLLPVEQVSASLQVADGVQLGAYYQFKWRPSRLPGVGSYFSDSDLLPDGGVVNFGVDAKGVPVILAYDNRRDLPPRNGGQGGVQLKWSPAGASFEYGFYAAQYHEKSPAVPVFDFINGNVHLAYAQDVRTFGASMTSSIGQLNWALEGSVRDNAALTSAPVVLVPGGAVTACGHSDGNPCYAVGRTAHLNLSGIYVLQPSALWQGGSVLAELAWNRTLKVTRDIFAPSPGATGVNGGLAANTTRDAWALRVIFEPQYFQVLPGVDVSLPIAVGYNPGGRSSAMFKFAGGVSGGGDYSVGIKGNYQNAWNFSLAYTNYFGAEGTLTQTLSPGNASPRQLSFAQTLKDRGFVSLSVSRTF